MNASAYPDARLHSLHCYPVKSGRVIDLQSARLGVEQMAHTGLASLTGKLVSVLLPVTTARDVAWNVNIDDDYHEEASSSSSPGEGAAKSGTYAPAAQTA